MTKRIESKTGERFSIDFFCIIDKSKSNEHREGTTFVEISGHYFYKVIELSVYYRPERTWDDHMGNTPCGYYCIVPLPTGERKRVYIC